MTHIVCIPHAGGGASTYASWKRTLGARLLAVTLPGRESRYAEPPLRHISDMAAWVVSELHKQEAEEIVLFGHSMGALVAYETARTLQRSTQFKLTGLVVSGCASPTVFRPDRLSDIADDGNFLKAVSEYGGLPSGLIDCIELRDYAIAVLRADLVACDTYCYEPEPRLNVPVLAFAGTADKQAPPVEMAWWERCTTSTFDLKEMRGGHFFIADHADTMLSEMLGWSGARECFA